MKKLRLDLDALRVHSFATGGATEDPFTDPSKGVSDCVSRWVRCVHRGTVGAHEARTTTDWCRYACPSWRCNHTTA